ncbi:hypothetical protein CGCS363_v006219 [Colletotrichum siamense]|uniref:uncharacterized protein n=1 Tax=Colletotrichum siamense TaxID=690259 RepID=UPI001872AEFF|nr:uncharacterized protein CGCS363_v006219 [Colletotrichum siamense]KAF5500935.1 hypothetical protein CGCS363_v006219 [Colletotrichum siamense]
MQQRVVPTTQPAGARTQARAAGPRSGPPSMANASQNRRSYPQPPPVNSQLPPYAGNPEDEWSPASRAAAAAAGGAGAGAGGYSRRRTERHARRQSSTSGAPTASDPALQMSGGAASSSPRINNNGDHHPQRAPSNPAGLRPPSPPTAGMNLGLAGDEISRLQSPSISKSVLEPLQRKMLEYHNLMEEAQGQMTQLDAELRALQERRRQAEQRFVDAKGKHDEYERQHLDVEKALRGDYAMPIPQPQQQQQQQQIHPQASSQQQHQMYNDSPPRTLGRPASSIMSYDERPMSGRSSMQGKKGKFRISLFGR